MRTCLEKATAKFDVDVFINQAHEILDRLESNQKSTANARKKARALICGFEDYLTSKGLKC